MRRTRVRRAAQAKLDVLEDHKKAHAEQQHALIVLYRNTSLLKPKRADDSKTADELMNDVQMLAGEVGDLDGKLNQMQETLRTKLVSRFCKPDFKRCVK